MAPVKDYMCLVTCNTFNMASELDYSTEDGGENLWSTPETSFDNGKERDQVTMKMVWKTLEKLDGIEQMLKQLLRSGSKKGAAAMDVAADRRLRNCASMPTEEEEHETDALNLQDAVLEEKCIRGTVLKWFVEKGFGFMTANGQMIFRTFQCCSVRALAETRGGGDCQGPQGSFTAWRAIQSVGGMEPLRLGV